MKRSILFFLFSYSFVFGAGLMIGEIVTTDKEKAKFDLPEEFNLITKADNLQGHFDKDSVFHLEFNNVNNGIQFIWNDDEESIPKDGSLIRLEYTNEDIVYIGPYNP